MFRGIGGVNGSTSLLTTMLHHLIDSFFLPFYKISFSNSSHLDRMWGVTHNVETRPTKDGLRSSF